MYKKITVNDLVRVDPKDFDKDLDEVILKRLNERYSGKIIKSLGLVLLAANPRNYSKGRVLHGDPGIYYRLDFDLYIFKPELNEVVKGEITDTAEFGAFIRIGALEGLCHISQLGFDYFAYNPQELAFVSKEDPNYKIKVRDKVLARIVGISLKESLKETKIGLTMRQVGLGVLND